jgi:hypothetical protein
MTNGHDQTRQALLAGLNEDRAGEYQAEVAG